jgi:glycosyltransferase involved in cell wall biosynthesis
MKLLTVHNRYLIRGGEDESRESEDRLLRLRGHEVQEFVLSNESVDRLGRLRTAIRATWSTQAYHQARRRIRQLRPDLVDVHNFFPLISPAIYHAARAERVPVIQTLHNYRLICPGALLARDGRVCEECVGKVPLRGILHKCYRDSYRGSAAVATMLTTHRLFGTWRNAVTLYIALTEFGRQKFIQGGLPAERIVVKPNFVPVDLQAGNGDGGFAMFVGRLTSEKGIPTLLRAWSRLKSPIDLKIIGDGPLQVEVASAAAASKNIEYLGRRPLSDVYALLGRASALIFPSEWYEGLGRVMIEAFAAGTPVIATNIGPICSLVAEGVNGIHFEPGNAEDLSAKVEWAFSHSGILKNMRPAARAEYEAKYTAERNYELMMYIYGLAVEMYRRSRSR